MPRTILKALALAALVCVVMATVVHAQQIPLPTTAAEVPGPAPGTAMTKPYVQAVARIAYVWGWPLVNAANRAGAFSKAPEPGLLGGVIPVAYNRLAMLTGYIAPNQHFIACPNQDVAYGAGFFDLDKEAAIIQVPDFGDRFWVFALYDGHTDEFASIGKQFCTKPGFYLMVGPNWKGEAPAGVNAVVRWVDAVEKYPAANRLLGDVFTCSWLGLFGEQLARIAMPLTQSTRASDLLAGRVVGARSS